MSQSRDVAKMTAGRAALVEGCESPFGLEVLSTAHWVVTKEQAGTLDKVVEGTYCCSARKRQFTRRQIEIAARVLSGQGWTSPLVTDIREAGGT